MAVVYRFRGMEKLLYKHCELKCQSIFFSCPDELNDPMEGARDIVWFGDGVAWTNLFKHYVFCLNQTLVDFRILGECQLLKAENIPVFGRSDKPSTAQMGELFSAIWYAVYTECGISSLIENLEKYQRKVRIGELQHYLYLSHFPMIMLAPIVRQRNGKNKVHSGECSRP